MMRGLILSKTGYKIQEDTIALYSNYGNALVLSASVRDITKLREDEIFIDEKKLSEAMESLYETLMREREGL